MSRHAQRESFSRCPETCPAVDKAAYEWIQNVGHEVPAWLEESLQEMVDGTKTVGTNKLRDALTETCSDLIEAQDEAEELKRQVRDHEATIEELRSQIRSLEHELSEAEALA